MSYVRCSFQGSTSGGEVWSINPVFDPTGEFPGGVDQGNLDAAAQLIANNVLGSNMSVALSSMLSFTGVRLEVRNDADDELIALSEAGRTVVEPGTGTPKMPPQSAIVVSLRTNTTGGSGRGRLYWPALGLTLEPTARIPQATAGNLATEMKTFLLAARSDLASSFTGIGFDLAVRSRATHTTPHVVRLQVGNVVDTQRRRTDKLAESFSAVSFP